MPIKSPSKGISEPLKQQISVNVTNTSSQALAANENREFLLLQNQDAANAIWVGFGKTAVANGTCLKISPGQTIVYDRNTICPNTTVNVIASVAGPSILHVQEY